MRISVNLSPRQFADPDLLSQVIRAVGDASIDPALPGIEITETMLMDDVEEAIKLLTQLQAMGMSISIDDFGTGYSSLAQLKRLPVDTLKIDRSFIRDMDVDRSDRKIVEAVVAEGGETETHLALLKRYGCDLGQGYLFSKPLPAGQIEERLFQRAEQRQSGR